MRLILDLHLHSKYARAVSKYMDLSTMAQAASRKGIDVLATGDWTHPKWFATLQDELQETAPGIFQLKKPPTLSRPVHFVLGTEISNLYRQGEHFRRVHNLVFAPSWETADAINRALEQHGARLDQDGRPNISMSSRDLLRLVKDIDSHTVFIPAHAWTPWFAVFGSRSGFDSLEEAFGDDSKEIHAIETGLSSDPEMNWRIKELDTRQVVSFSDAHSPAKLGREATVLEGKTNTFTYSDLMNALEGKSGPFHMAHTIEYFPEEGKYHWSGHRAHNLRQSPEEDLRKGITCPVCGKRLTVGVVTRMNMLGEESRVHAQVRQEVDRQCTTYIYDAYKKRVPFTSTVPLLELAISVLGSKTKGEREYDRLLDLGFTEFDLLLYAPIKTLDSLENPALSSAIKAVRSRRVMRDPGYDGVFGTVSVQESETQSSLF